MKGDLKMKAKYIFAASLLVAGAAFADTTTVETEYTIGVFPLAVSAGETIINVPWVESGSDGSGVAVSNLVKTAGLSAGDALLWYDTTKSEFDAWKVVTRNGTNYWEATTSIDIYGSKKFTSADSTSLTKGQAIILRTQNATTAYIVGQVSDASGSSSIAPGTKASPTMTLIAPPAVTGSTELVAKFAGKAAKNDQITIWDSTNSKWKTYTFNGTKWGVPGFDTSQTPPEPTFEPVETISLPAGCGVWYKRCSGETAETVNW